MAEGKCPPGRDSISSRLAANNLLDERATLVTQLRLDRIKPTFQKKQYRRYLQIPVHCKD
jgi:hypothetical protein